MDTIIPDPFLSKDPDIPVFGLNLACAYPFPKEIEASYTQFADRFSQLDPAVYVYPFWETHITIATFVNFATNQRPAAELQATIQEIIKSVKPLFSSGKIKPFRMEFLPPVLTAKAGYLPLENSTGEIAQIRRRITELVKCDNIPGIIHSTILRFRQAPKHLPAFIAGFNAIAATTQLGTIAIRKILLTAETKPYMREGSILHRFPLS